jgi:hypothetical protein
MCIMESKGKLTTVVMWLIFSFASSNYCLLHAQSPQSSGGVVVFIHPPWDKPLTGIGSKDFTLTQSNREIAATLRRPSIKGRNGSSANMPTNVLVILDPRAGSSFGDQKNILNKLKHLWDQGFLVSVQLPGLTASPFASSVKEIQSKLQGIASVTDPTAESIRAIKTLGSCTGRRAILYILGTSGMGALKPPPQIIKMTSEIMAQLYIVDGGRPSGSSDYVGPITHVRSSEPWSLPAITEIGIIPKVPYPAQNMYSLGVYHEIDLKTAENTLISDSNNYFDLTLQCGTTHCIDLNSPVVLQIRRQGPLRIVSQTYGDLSRVGLRVEAE